MNSIESFSPATVALVEGDKADITDISFDPEALGLLRAMMSGVMPQPPAAPAHLILTHDGGNAGDTPERLAALLTQALADPQLPTSLAPLMAGLRRSLAARSGQPAQGQGLDLLREAMATGAPGHSLPLNPGTTNQFTTNNAAPEVVTGMRTLLAALSGIPAMAASDGKDSSAKILATVPGENAGVPQAQPRAAARAAAPFDPALAQLPPSIETSRPAVSASLTEKVMPALVPSQNRRLESAVPPQTTMPAAPFLVPVQGTAKLPAAEAGSPALAAPAITAAVDANGVPAPATSKEAPSVSAPVSQADPESKSQAFTATPAQVLSGPVVKSGSDWNPVISEAGRSGIAAPTSPVASSVNDAASFSTEHLKPTHPVSSHEVMKAVPPAIVFAAPAQTVPLRMNPASELPSPLVISANLGRVEMKEPVIPPSITASPMLAGADTALPPSTALVRNVENPAQISHLTTTVTVVDDFSPTPASQVLSGVLSTQLPLPDAGKTPSIHAAPEPMLDHGIGFHSHLPPAPEPLVSETPFRALQAFDRSSDIAATLQGIRLALVKALTEEEEHPVVKPALNEPQRPNTSTSLGQSILQTLGAQSSVAAQPAVNDPVVRPVLTVERIEQVSALMTEMADRVLVTDPVHGQTPEVRIKIAEHLMPDTEVRVTRDTSGQLRVEFETVSPQWARALNDASPLLAQRLSEKLPHGEAAPQVVVQQQGEQPQDGRSRNRHNPWELARQSAES